MEPKNFTNASSSPLVINSGNHEYAGSPKKSSEKGGGVEIPLIYTPQRETLANSVKYVVSLLKKARD